MATPRATSPRPPAQPRQPADRKAPAKKTAVRSQSAAARKANAAIVAKRAAGRGNTVNGEQLAEQVEIERPDGMPETRTLLAIMGNRRRKADWAAALAVLQGRMTERDMAKVQALDNSESEGTDAIEALGGTREAARLGVSTAQLVADVEDLLVVVAVDQDDMRAWAAEVDDADLLTAWTWWQQENPVGEAAASPS